MNELYHHGIKGMHWGVRRYQNPDGTLTAAGKRRERSEDRSIRRDVKQQRMWNAKNASQLSDEDLTKQILRLQREKQLKDLTSQTVAPGRKHVHDLLKRYGDQAITAAVSTAIGVGITQQLNKAMKDKARPDFEQEVAEETRRVRIKEEAQKRASNKGYWTKHYENGRIKE